MLNRAAATLLAAALLAVALLAGCSTADQGSNTDPGLVDSTAVPEAGLCRELTVEDVRHPTNASKSVPCTEKHTAETFAVGELPGEFAGAAYDDAAVARFAYRTCSTEFATFVNADESLVLRTTVSWAWFRPSQKAWDGGARWYRCDVIGGTSSSTAYRELPTTARDLLAGRPKDVWLACGRGPGFADSEKVPCSQKHDWRAATTVKIGEQADAYPGDAVMESRTRSFCSTSIKAWLGYPSEFDYAWTHFHKAEWDAGTHLSVCWARTSD